MSLPASVTEQPVALLTVRSWRLAYVRSVSAAQDISANPGKGRAAMLTGRGLASVSIFRN